MPLGTKNQFEKLRAGCSIKDREKDYLCNMNRGYSKSYACIPLPTVQLDFGSWEVRYDSSPAKQLTTLCVLFKSVEPSITLLVVLMENVLNMKS